MQRIFRRRKKCKFCSDKVEEIKYDDVNLLRKLTTERGKIIPSRITGTCARHQRQIAKAMKRSRHLAMMPYVAK